MPRHLGEDEVGGAVDDAVYAVDPGPSQRLLQHTNDGHDAGHSALETKLYAGVTRDLEQLIAVLREQLLVGGDDMPAGTHRLQHVAPGRLDPADQLDDQIRAIQDRLEVTAGT